MFDYKETNEYVVVIDWFNEYHSYLQANFFDVDLNGNLVVMRVDDSQEAQIVACYNNWVGAYYNDHANG